jgi:co-chaperonin GroES (HSP10)
VSTPTFKLFGNRVILKDTDDPKKEIDGIVMGESHQRMHMAMEVVSMGDGRLIGSNQLTRSVAIKPGDRVFIQFNPNMFANNMQKVEGVRYLAIHQHDVLAKVSHDSYVWTLDDWTPVGHWVLLRVETPDKVGKIWLPGSNQPMKSAGEVKLYVEKFGELAGEELGIQTGMRVMAEASRCNPFSLNRSLTKEEMSETGRLLGPMTKRQAYVYVDTPSILGVIEL